jgi:hypothetical protein
LLFISLKFDLCGRNESPSKIFWSKARTSRRRQEHSWEKRTYESLSSKIARFDEEQKNRDHQWTITYLKRDPELQLLVGDIEILLNKMKQAIHEGMEKEKDIFCLGEMLNVMQVVL